MFLAASAAVIVLLLLLLPQVGGPLRGADRTSTEVRVLRAANTADGRYVESGVGRSTLAQIAPHLSAPLALDLLREVPYAIIVIRETDLATRYLASQSTYPWRRTTPAESKAVGFFGIVIGLEPGKLPQSGVTALGRVGPVSEGR